MGWRWREELTFIIGVLVHVHVHVGGYSAIGWNHPGFGDSSVS